MIKINKILLLLSIPALMYSCGDPSKVPATESARDANNTDSSSSDEQFNKDTTINMSSGGGTGIDMAKGDSLPKEGKASGQQ